MWLHISKKESERFMDSLGEGFGRGFVEVLFGPMIEIPKKKVKK